MENKGKPGKPESSRLNLFYILQVLDIYTDEQNPMSAAEIADRINHDFEYVSKTGAVISTDTVKRTMEELIQTLFPTGVDYREKLHQYGYYIFCVRREKDAYVPYGTSEGKQAPKKYYYLENDLQVAEILTLKDAIETYSYFSEEDITEIVRKLVRVRPGSFPSKRYIDRARNDRDEDSLLLMNLDELNEIIRHGNSARITYCHYDIRKELVPRKGYPKVIEPLYTMWSNGYYYLLAYHEKYDSTVSYRIDRITEVEEVESEKSERAESFNPVQYRHEHPVMFGGKKQKIVMLCRCTEKNYFMNTIMDVFGRNARVTVADKELIESKLPHSQSYYEEQNITWLKVTIESAIGGVALWATQYCRDCLVLAPLELREMVKQTLQAGLEYYS